MGVVNIRKENGTNRAHESIGTGAVIPIRKSILIGILSLAIASFCGVGVAGAASHDVAWTFGNNGFSDYVLNSYSPAGAALGPIGGLDPTLTLKLNGRYQVTVVNYQSHPLQILAKASSSASDVVLLSMGSTTGSFESDSDVAFVDNGAGTITFTLTLGLYDAMNLGGRQPGYRCEPHASFMRGNFTIVGLPLSDPIPTSIDKGTVKIEMETVASGLAGPVHMVPATDGSGKLFVVDQAGKVYVIADGQLRAEPFLDVTERVVSPLGIIGSHDENDFDERGLLGMALHPGFADAASGGYQKVYTYTSEPDDGPADFTTDPKPDQVNHQSVVSEWTVDPVDPVKIDPDSRREILRIDQPQFNHNGGMLAFGPDGYLYISLGDGGGANDTGDGHGPAGNGQNKNTVYGSIMRIDPLRPSVTPDSVDSVSTNGKYRIPEANPFVGKTGVDEIFAYGLRNPFRFSFDTTTGDLVVGDVGQDHVEEVDIVEIGGNYGWNLKEGTFRFDPATGGVTDDLSALPDGLIDPVAQYDHDDGLSVIGGYVYRGTAIPELAGKYVFGDFSRSFSTPEGRLFYADLDAGNINELIIGLNNRALGLYVKGFGQDSLGEVYVLAGTNLGPYGLGGVVLKIVDLCTERIPGDLNNDCEVNFQDMAIMASNWLRNTQR